MTLSNLNSILSLIILFNLFLFNVFRCWDLVLNSGNDTTSSFLLLDYFSGGGRCSWLRLGHGHGFIVHVWLVHRLCLSLAYFFLLLFLLLRLTLSSSVVLLSFNLRAVHLGSILAILLVLLLLDTAIFVHSSCPIVVDSLEFLDKQAVKVRVGAIRRNSGQPFLIRKTHLPG